MLKRIVLIGVIVLCFGCKKQFTPSGLVSTNSNYLVIDGAVNSGNDSTFIKLTRTKNVDNSNTFTPETNAQVSVESDGGNSYPLQEIITGTYSAAPLNLDGSHKYRIRIKTTDNKEYLSDLVVVKNAPPIDSVSFVPKSTGVQIYVSSHDVTNSTLYYRWEYAEAWKFHSTYFSTYSGQSHRAVLIYYCYSNSLSSDIVIASSIKLNKDIIFESPVTLVPSNAEKLEIKYSILVKEYALTADAYAFWEYLQKNTEQLGSIFDVQPSENLTNYHCLTNPAELVIGYLSVGATTSKRIYITRDQLPANYNPAYQYACQVDTENFNSPRPGDPSLDNSTFTAIGAQFFPPFNPFGLPNALTYSTIDCVDCRTRGTLTPPPFWQE